MTKRASCELGGQKNWETFNASGDLAKGGRKLEKQEKAEEGWNRQKTCIPVTFEQVFGNIAALVCEECEMLGDGAPVLQASPGIT